MRCVACDEPMTPMEQSRKSPTTGQEYLLCTPCLREAGLLSDAIENPIAEDVYQDIAMLTDEDFR